MEQENFSIISGKTTGKGISSFNFILRELENILNLLRSNADPETFTRYIEFLKDLTDKNDLSEDEVVKVSNVIKECLSLSVSYIENVKKNSSEESGIYLELYSILAVVVLNFSNIDDIEYNNIAFHSITKSSKLVKFFNCQGHYEKGEYYGRKCKYLTMKLIDKCNDVFIRKVLSDKKMTIDLYYIESVSNVGKLDEGFDEIQKVKERLSEYPNHQKYFLNICYNISIKFYKKAQYDYSITLLETALNVATDAKQSCGDISTIPRLLTHIYMKENPAINWQKCLNIFNLMKEREVPITFFPDLLNAAFISGNQSVITDILNHFHKYDFSTSLLAEIIEKLSGEGYYKIAIDFIQKARKKPLESKEKLCLLGLELQMHFKISSLEKASVLLEDAIKLVTSVNITLRQSTCFCKVLFSYADGLFKSKSFMQCLTWYKKFLKFVEATKINAGATNYLKQRICLCYLEMKEGQLAKQMLMKIEWRDTKANALQLYLTLQTAIICEDPDLADTVLIYTGHYNNQMEEVLLACCGKSFSLGKTSFICKILETLIGKFNVIEGKVFHLKLSQLLIKLYLGFADVMENQEKILFGMRKALEIADYIEKGENIEDTMEWFCRIAWNMALKTGTEVRNVFEFFDVCCLFLEKLKGSHVRLKNALIFVVAAGIQTLRERVQAKEIGEECRNVSRKVLTAIDKCRNVEKENNKILCMLYVYEFETRILLEDPAAETILKQMLQKPFVDAEALQLAASIAYEKSSNNFTLITAALEGAINKKTDDHRDCEKSQLYHSLLQVLFFTQEYITSSVEEQNMNICQTVLKRLEDGSFEEYPEMKLLWLMTKCWNWGVHKLSDGNSTSSHGWCLLAMKFLQKLKGFKHLHEEKLQALFSSYFGTYDM